jgi:glycosyltransferase involved in cell wall biosynthesis
MNADRQPLVSVGVPVFNGEAGLARCLDGLLRQDYNNLEIIISDNGSTDATPAICEAYARRDPRVKWVRSEENRGLVWNFNRVSELATGTYFMLAAHDDERAAEFVSACVERLEQRPDAVLCAAHAEVTIAGTQPVLYVTHFDTVVDRIDAVDRYEETLKRLPLTAIYGVFRASALRTTKRFRRVIGTDTAFIRELLIYGPLTQVPRVLFKYQARPTWNTIHHDARVFLGVERKPWWYVPFVVLLVDQCTRILHAPVAAGLKLRLARALLWHELREASLRLIVKAIGAVCPEHRKEQVGQCIYRRWMNNPNIHVITPDVYFERVCKPQLGWWR